MYNKKPRVLNVIGSLEVGGAESLLYYLHKHFKSKGYGNFTLCTLVSEGDFYQKAKEEGLQVISLNLSSKRDPRAIPRLIEVIRDGQYNIVHSHLSAAALYSVMAVFLCKHAKLIHTFHGIAPKCKAGLRGIFTRKLVAKKACRLVGIGDVDRKVYSKAASIPESKISMIENGVEPSALETKISNNQKRDELRIDHEIPILFAVGRLCEQKGYDVLIKAAKLLKEQKQKYVLLIAGDGPLRKQMNSLRNELFLQKEVIFLGTRDDVPEILNTADIFVQASNWEGLSISIIEAMICGKPIIATSVGGNKTLIVNEVSGILVPPKDPISLACSLSRLMNDSGMRLILGQNARRYALNKFTIDSMSRKLINLYNMVLRD